MVGYFLFLKVMRGINKRVIYFFAHLLQIHVVASINFGTKMSFQNDGIIFYPIFFQGAKKKPESSLKTPGLTKKN